MRSIFVARTNMLLKRRERGRVSLHIAANDLCSFVRQSPGTEQTSLRAIVNTRSSGDADGSRLARRRMMSRTDGRRHPGRYSERSILKSQASCRASVAFSARLTRRLAAAADSESAESPFIAAAFLMSFDKSFAVSRATRSFSTSLRSAAVSLRMGASMSCYSAASACACWLIMFRASFDSA